MRILLFYVNSGLNSLLRTFTQIHNLFLLSYEEDIEGKDIGVPLYLEN